MEAIKVVITVGCHRNAPVGFDRRSTAHLVVPPPRLVCGLRALPQRRLLLSAGCSCRGSAPSDARDLRHAVRKWERGAPAAGRRQNRGQERRKGGDDEGTPTGSQPARSAGGRGERDREGRGLRPCRCRPSPHACWYQTRRRLPSCLTLAFLLRARPPVMSRREAGPSSDWPSGGDYDVTVSTNLPRKDAKASLTSGWALLSHWPFFGPDLYLDS